MEIVGIDFGTTNVRISTWDMDDPDAGLPQPRIIGRGGTSYMPVVVALQRQENNSVSIIVGEDADGLEDSTNTVVIRNIKRWAQASDPTEGRHIKERLDTMGIPHPTTWVWKESESNKPGYIETWGQRFEFHALMREVLKEAISRANLPDEFEWRAGCPVHAGIGYRTWLNEILTEFSRKGSINWIADEPVLLLALIRRMSYLQLGGSYLIYDLGGGSFDCALVEVPEDGKIIIHGADGHPLLGGSDIDRALKQQFVDAPVNLLRFAKERVSPIDPVVPVSASASVTWNDVKAILTEQKFMLRSLMALRDSYVSAKLIWGRRKSDFPCGPTIIENDEDDSVGDKTGATRFVWQLNYDDMKSDMVEDAEGNIILNNIILFGGPTRSPFFSDNLRRRFGDDKVISTSDLLPGVSDPELVALSMGACYFAEDAERAEDRVAYADYNYMVTNRLPVNITLTGKQYGEIGYSAHQALSSGYGLLRSYESPVLRQNKDNPQEYELTITNPDGVVLKKHNINGFLEPGGGITNERNRQPATSLRLIISRLGFVFVEMKSEGVGLSWTETFPVFPDPENDPPPWQSETQRNAWRELEKRLAERARNKSRRLALPWEVPWRDRGR